MNKKTAIQPTRQENYPEWYLQVIKAADLAEHSPVRGCMVIKPWGYSIWENVQKTLDGMIKETGHQNAYFPLFIPLSFLEKEAQHVEGFAKECAVVTHHRLEKNAEGKLVPAGPLEEPLIVRPTSETIIGEMFAKWVESYRDLPLLINQWANIVRWEMRTRLFLRTAEILWQEGHTAHATKEEAIEETLLMLHTYNRLACDYLAIPMICGEKTASERFPGAIATYTIEAMMQDRKALQSGTSHFLGQNFAKASGIQFNDKNGEQAFAWTTSWGVTTRLIGALIMTHGDDDGLVLPPRIAPAHVVLLPILHRDEQRSEVLAYCHALVKELNQCTFYDQPIRAIVDERDLRGGEKGWSWIKKGVPLRIEIGPRDIASDQFGMMRRDRPHRETKMYSKSELKAQLGSILEEMQQALYDKAKTMRDENIHRIDSKEEFYAFFTPKNRDNPEIHGGFALCHWSGEECVEEIVKKDLNVTIRCIPLDQPEEEGRCVISGKPSRKRVIFAKAY
ncbi:MAG: proline--tRNA ligase [Simkania sp.]|nr:proline--tRNA ligase [Simkania sp.]